MWMYKYGRESTYKKRKSVRTYTFIVNSEAASKSRFILEYRTDSFNKMVAENGALGLNARDTEILLCISLTVNFCMMWNLAVPIVCRLICGKEGNRTASTDTLHEATSELPCRRRL